MHIHVLAFSVHYHHWRIIMTSMNFAKTLRRSLILVSAALVFQTGAASAADGVGDAQTQARELLGGKAPSRPVVSTLRSEAAASLPGVEPQEQARRLILGIQSFDKARAAVRMASTSEVEHGDRRAPINAQALAQRMILGHGG
jgi:hypothetical protein